MQDMLTSCGSSSMGRREGRSERRQQWGRHERCTSWFGARAVDPSGRHLEQLGVELRFHRHGQEESEPKRPLTLIGG